MLILRPSSVRLAEGPLTLSVGLVTDNRNAELGQLCVELRDRQGAGALWPAAAIPLAPTVTASPAMSMFCTWVDPVTLPVVPSEVAVAVEVTLPILMKPARMEIPDSVALACALADVLGAERRRRGRHGADADDGGRAGERVARRPTAPAASGRPRWRRRWRRRHRAWRWPCCRWSCWRHPCSRRAGRSSPSSAPAGTGWWPEWARPAPGAAARPARGGRARGRHWPRPGPGRGSRRWRCRSDRSCRWWPRSPRRIRVTASPGGGSSAARTGR